jgi:hypothetical protein
VGPDQVRSLVQIPKTRPYALQSLLIRGRAFSSAYSSTLLLVRSLDPTARQSLHTIFNGGSRIHEEIATAWPGCRLVYKSLGLAFVLQNKLKIDEVSHRHDETHG